MTRLHLPSLQAAAALASATPKDKAPLRLIQVIGSRSKKNREIIETLKTTMEEKP